MICIFTGLVEEIGEVISIKNDQTSLKIKIRSKKVIEKANIGDSIATNGTCLTATEIGNDFFVADCMHETVKRTNLKRLKTGSKINLEKSITLSTPLGGHLVTGDVDTEGQITSIREDGIAKIYQIKIDRKYMKYIVDKGRVTIDGASLTVMELTNDTFSVSLIPHSQEMIILGKTKVGDYVNVETDLIGKYVEKLMNFSEENNAEPSKITAEFLLKNGF
ncbi:riboflavin synthase [Fusobacterium sp. PH5-44]